MIISQRLKVFCYLFNIIKTHIHKNPDSYLFANLVTFAYYFLKLCHLEFEPKHFHANNQIPTGGTYLDLISRYYSETFQLLVSYHVPVFLSRSLDLRIGKKEGGIDIPMYTISFSKILEILGKTLTGLEFSLFKGYLFLKTVAISESFKLLRKLTVINIH